MPYLEELIDFIYNSGANCSIITNGSLLTSAWILRNANKLHTFGVSIDSLSEKTNIALGRCNTKQIGLDLFALQTQLHILKELNPNCQIKINTVVSKLNYEECLFNFVKECSCNRWKLLKLHPFLDNGQNNTSLSVTDQEFSTFVTKNIPDDFRFFDLRKNQLIHQDKVEVVIEPDMEASYFIIDARGYLLDNCNHKYTDVIDCKTEAFSKGIEKLSFRKDSYNSRYNHKK